MGEIFLLTGTDTGVGKTYIGILLLKKLLESGIDAFVMKPVESGCVYLPDGTLAAEDAMRYLSCLDTDSATVEDICLYRYPLPLSPNVAGRLAGELVDKQIITSRIQGEADRRAVVIVEGAGGIMVEIADGYSFLSLAKDLNMKAILVAPNRLGVLNHVALNVNVLSVAEVNIAGIILNDLSVPSETAAQYNFEELKRVHGDLLLPHISFDMKEIPDGIIERLRGLSD